MVTFGSCQSVYTNCQMPLIFNDQKRTNKETDIIKLGCYDLWPMSKRYVGLSPLGTVKPIKAASSISTILLMCIK